MYIKVLTYLIILFYLLYQAKMDAKTGMVLKILNDSILFLSFIGFVVATIVYKIVDFPLSIGVCLMLLFFSSDYVPKFLKVMQRADAKAFTSIYFSSFIIWGQSGALIIICFSILIANLFFMGWHHIIKREKIHMVSDIHKPYFPFILLGYFCCTIVYITNTA